MATVQVHVVYGKKDERVAGPADADVVVTVNAPDAFDVARSAWMTAVPAWRYNWTFATSGVPVPASLMVPVIAPPAPRPMSTFDTAPPTGSDTTVPAAISSSRHSAWQGRSLKTSSTKMSLAAATT